MKNQWNAVSGRRDWDGVVANRFRQNENLKLLEGDVSGEDWYSAGAVPSFRRLRLVTQRSMVMPRSRRRVRHFSGDIETTWGRDPDGTWHAIGTIETPGGVVCAGASIHEDDVEWRPEGQGGYIDIGGEVSGPWYAASGVGYIDIGYVEIGLFGKLKKALKKGVHLLNPVTHVKAVAKAAKKVVSVTVKAAGKGLKAVAKAGGKLVKGILKYAKPFLTSKLVAGIMAAASVFVPAVGITYMAVRAAMSLVDGLSKGDPAAQAKAAELAAQAAQGIPGAQAAMGEIANVQQKFGFSPEILQGVL